MKFLRLVPIISIAALALVSFCAVYKAKHQNPPAEPPYAKLAAELPSHFNGLAAHPAVEYAFSATPRKHKRKLDPHHFQSFGYGSWSAPRDQWHIINLEPAMVTCDKPSKDAYGQCSVRPLTPEEIEQYKPMVQQFHTTPNFTPDPKDTFTIPQGESKPSWLSPSGVPNGTAGLNDGDHHQSLNDGPDAINCANANEGRCPYLFHKGEAPSATAWPIPTGQAQIQLTEAQKDAYPDNAWMKPCGSENHADACYIPKPACKMPADIDVCPVQMLDSRERKDSK